MGETDTGGLNIIVYKRKKMKDKGGEYGCRTKILTSALLLVTEGLLGQ